MLPVSKILLSSLFISYMAVGSVYTYGQDAIINSNKPKKSISIGFQTGREQLFYSTPLLHIRSGKAQCQVNNSLYVIKTLSKRIKLQTGIKYTTIQNTTGIKGLDKKNMLLGKQKSISTPFTLQYYFIPEHSRLHVYCGAGVQYNLLNRNNNNSPFTSDINVDRRAPLAGTKYLSVLITQGITFQINTKIQLSESFRFSAGDTAKTIGFDIGVGYIIR